MHSECVNHNWNVWVILYNFFQSCSEECTVVGITDSYKCMLFRMALHAVLYAYWQNMNFELGINKGALN
jgi:hypothetical protein